MAFDEIFIEIGKNIKQLRNDANLTQEALAEKAGLSLDFMGKIEVSINRPSIYTLIKLSQALDVPLKEFF